MAESLSLGEAFLMACARHGSRRAIVDGAEDLTYEAFAQRVRERAAALDCLLGAEEVRIALHATNSVDYLVSYYALLVAGRLPFLVDVQFGKAELDGIWSGCGVDAFLTDRPDRFPLEVELVAVPGTGHRLARTVEVRRETPPEPDPDTATCRFTSGTTGAPKCLEFSHTAVQSAARTWIDGTGLGPDDRILCLAAFTNGLAFNTSLLPVFLVGAELHIYKGLPTSAGIARALQRSKATRLVAFPLAYRLLAETTEPDLGAFETLTRAVSAAAVLAPEIREGFEARYRVRIADYYGIAETGPCTFERDPEHTAGLGTALPGVVLRIVRTESGEPEVRVRTASMASRYLNLPGGLEERVDADGYYRTGDCGRLEAGRLFITGRISGPINVAGRKIDPEEIERVVLALDGVGDCAVFADADDRGETVLHVVLAGAREVGRTEVIEACRAHLAPYKVPGRVTFLPRIPRSSAGKIRLSEIKGLVRTTRIGSDA